jgi:hypothetical protein
MYRSNLTIVVVMIFALQACEKEVMSQHPIKSAAESLTKILPICDDTSVFKTSYDLEPFDHIQDCFLATATKEVPGLGTADWTLNVHTTIGISTVGMGMRLETYADFGPQNFIFERELITLSFPLAEGLHPINSSFYVRLADDGDVGEAEWDLDTNCTNFVEILQLDLECREVRGNFELHFILEGQSISTPHSERVNFINGKFEARIKKF